MVTKGHKHDHGVDIWAVGVLTIELLTGHSPFAPDSNKYNKNAVEKKTQENIMNCNYKMWPDFNPEAKDLVSKILVKDPKERATI